MSKVYRILTIGPIGSGKSELCNFIFRENKFTQNKPSCSCSKSPKICQTKRNELNIEIRGDKKVTKIIDCNPATDEDFYTEYNDYIIAIKIVSNINEAIDFINTHSTNHSESIITEDNNARDIFLQNIDSACVYHNTSTRFTDGGEFGFGAELGISTQKMHARGPMGIREMTTYKYLIYGTGQVRT